ncbi:MAG TPA: RNA polymerase sigma factor RpoD/SigA [Vicinamibacterales bacterium]|nr:RNA polymerase sigma factor RpoD/SigA [Vicinamibacterales bacterium]
MARQSDRSDDDALRAYLRAIARVPRLTPEEEQALGQRIRRSGGTDEEAVRRLVEANLPFVVAYAKKYRGLGLPFIDLIHEGNLGLLEAARRYDPSRGVKFITYAVWWIRQAILQALAGAGRPWVLPARAHAGSDEPDDVEAPGASEAETAADDERESDRLPAWPAPWAVRSLADRLFDEEDSPALEDTLEQAVEPPIEEEVMRRTLRERLEAALGELTERERAVMRLRYGLDGDGEPRTLQQVGTALGLSRERVRQIEARAKEKLRRSKRAAELRGYLN